MRIISGKFKGKRFEYIKSSITRPLKDSVRENIFNILQHSNEIKVKIELANVLDLYSGIGSFGIECISRGAKKVTFVENDLNALKILNNNLKKLSALNGAEIIKDSITKFIEFKNTKKYEIIFLDPPYANKTYYENLINLKERKVFKKDHIVIIHREKNSKEYLGHVLRIFKEKIYGRSKIIFGKFK
tara:strand:+ start:245 stop:805 length:561 start_codon:yes stop_codon:yes gene_type:complete